MRKYIYISIGGALGAVSRLAIENVRIWGYSGAIPLNTFIINFTGSFFLALFLTVAFEVMEIDADIRLGISTGFLGAFTTFSMLCKEIVLLMNDGKYFSAISYITLSIVLGLVAAFLGIIMAKEVITKFVGEDPEDVVEVVGERGES